MTDALGERIRLAKAQERARLAEAVAGEDAA